jgi:hypothetical protein
MRRACLTLAFLVAAGPAFADPIQHGNVIVDLPPGWSGGAVGDDGTLTLLSDLPDDLCEFCYAYIATGSALGTRPDHFLATQVIRFIDDDETPDRSIVQGPKAITAGGHPAALMAQRVGGDMQILFAIQLAGRVELMAFEGPAEDPGDAASTLGVFQHDIAPMFENARFISEGAEPLFPPATPGPLGGSYWGFSTGWTIGLDGQMQMTLNHTFLTFWPDGHFYDGTPPDGTRTLDPAALLARADPHWGSYAVAGNAVTLAFADGSRRKLTVAGQGLDDNGTALQRIDLIGDGARVAGIIDAFNFTGFTPGTGVSGGVATQSSLVLDTDGTWARSGWAGATGTFESGGDLTGGYTTRSGNEKRGTYAVANGVITLTENDNSVFRRDLIFRLGADIVIGEDTLKPRQ